ncbi:integrase core domain protein [Mycobacterium intracellulare ATCC 13950]|uniref:Integrase core domain protein n=1 Tax=Mycobacterium intracellulare (strain ATCC 13950 / DSM 43223 / JCM 6384 / NCTC 13025 / 3600) TaxID=487521 RepID=H8ILS0_MYCIA|nr:integrase core domain protein [Mycobacterium intracellulare ATCC 13950]
MIAYIDAHRDQFGVELICRVLRAAIPGFLTSRGYRAARTRPPSDREIRDEQLIADLEAVHRQNYSVYGVKKLLGVWGQEDARGDDTAWLAAGP